MKSTFKVLFYLKKGSEKKNGEVMIMARITIDGQSQRQGCREDKRPFGRHTFFPEYHLPRNAAA